MCSPSSTPSQTQVPYFGILGGIAIAVGIVLILFTPWVKKMMKGVR